MGFGALALGYRSSDLKKIRVVVHRDKVCLDEEPFVGVDYGAIGSKGIDSVIRGALLSHLVVALGASVTITVFARVRRQLEAVVVRLHDFDGRALILWRSSAALGRLNVTVVVHCDKIDTSDASTAHTVH